MNKNTIVDMKTSQFPFGQLEEETQEGRKILIKKRIFYKNQKQLANIQEKINILKSFYHKNIINFRYVQDDQPGFIEIYYNYVPFAFQNFFQQCDTQIIRQIHKQLIQLVIHLAKHNILTSFNPSRCGVILNSENKWQIKYYLPLNELLITDNISMLERGVQIFTVQSLHYLDLIAESSNDQDSARFSHSRDLPRKLRGSASFTRRDNQTQVIKDQKKRKMSNQGGIYLFPRRKFSNISMLKSQVSHETQPKTNTSTMLKTLRSSDKTIDCTGAQSQRMLQKLKPSSSLDIIQRVKMARERSVKAMKSFSIILKQIQMVKEIKICLEKRVQKQKKK